MSNVLITGATGTFGRAFIRRALHDDRWHRVVAFSRDEVKQAALAAEFGADGPHLFLGDVRDAARLSFAMRGVETVVHAAALKRVDAGAYSPSEMIATNVLGTMHVVNTAIQQHVARVIVLSSDKCCAPINIYGLTKGLAESYAVHANAYGYPSGTRIAAVRYGNIIGSRGSVFWAWRDQVARGDALALTDRRMTRFIMTIEHAVDLVLFALDRFAGGEVFVPILPSATLYDLAQATAPPRDGGYPISYNGVRPGGEKLHERLLNDEEPSRTWELDGHYVIAPSHHEWTAERSWGTARVHPELVYTSNGVGQPFLSVPHLRALIATTEACRSHESGHMHG